MVLLDVDVMKDIVRNLGWMPEFDVESDYPLQAIRNGGEEQARLSGHMLARAAMEVLSLKWVVEEGIRGMEEGAARAQSPFNKTGRPISQLPS